MASDTLNQVGKSLGKNRSDINHSQNRYAQNFPLIERLRDSMDATHPFHMEFLITHLNNDVRVSFHFQEAFQVTC